MKMERVKEKPAWLFFSGGERQVCHPSPSCGHRECTKEENPFSHQSGGLQTGNTSPVSFPRQTMGSGRQ